MSNLKTYAQYIYSNIQQEVGVYHLWSSYRFKVEVIAKFSVSNEVIEKTLDAFLRDKGIILDIEKVISMNEYFNYLDRLSIDDLLNLDISEMSKHELFTLIEDLEF